MGFPWDNVGFNKHRSPMKPRTLISTPDDFAKTVRQARRARGENQADLAERASLSRYTVIDAESGQSDPRLSTMLKLAEGLGMTIALIEAAKDSDDVPQKNVAETSQNLETLEGILEEAWSRFHPAILWWAKKDAATSAANAAQVYRSLLSGPPEALELAARLHRKMREQTCR